MTTVKSECKQPIERRVQTCSVNHLIFDGCLRTQGKRPSTVGFTGGLLPLSSPALDSQSDTRLKVNSDLPEIDNVARHPATGKRSMCRARTSGYYRGVAVLSQTHRSRSAPVGCADIQPQVASPSGDPITYNWLTENDIRTNGTKEAAGRFYKHTYGTGSCNSIQVNFPAAGRFVDNHKLNSKQRGYVRWENTSDNLLTGNRLLERLHELDSLRQLPLNPATLNQIPYRTEAEPSECLYTKVAQSIGIVKRNPDFDSAKSRFHGNQDDNDLLELVADCNKITPISKKEHNNGINNDNMLKNRKCQRSKFTPSRPITKKELSISVPYS